MRGSWAKIKFCNAVENINLVRDDSVAYGIKCVVGSEHINPENVHIRRWNLLKMSR